MADVNITIGAKDAATQTLQKVAASTQQLNATVKKMATGFVAAFAAIKGAQAVWSFVDAANEAFIVQDRAQRGASEASKEFASQLQRVAGIGDEVTLGLMRQAQALGVSEDQLGEAAKAAIGYSQATGQGLTEALRTVVNQTGDLTEINEIATRGLQQQREAMQGLEGVQTRANNSWGDMLEVVGQILAPIRAIVSQGIAVFAEVMQSALTPAVNMANAAMERMPQIFEMVNKVVIGAVTAIEVTITNFPQIVEAAVLQAELYWIQFSESVKHVLTSVIPQYLGWFGDNWVNMLTDIFQAGLTIVQNRMKQYGDIIIALWDWVKGGFQGGAEAIFKDIGVIASRNLLEGFEAQTQALPDIVARQLTDRERELSGRIGDIGSAIGEEFATKFDERMKAAGAAFEDFQTMVNFGGRSGSASGLAGSGSTSLTATQGRLITRGNAGNDTQRLVKASEMSLAELRDIKTVLQERNESAPVELVVIGGTA